MVRHLLSVASSASARDLQIAEQQLERGGRLPALDGLRGLAIVLVMLFHFLNEPIHGNRLLAVLFSVAHMGQIGVDLFFVLSGFLITGILIDVRDQPHYFRNFYVRRTLRIFPLYYGTLTLLYGVLPFLGAARWWPGWNEAAPHQVWQWLYGSNIAAFLGIPLIAGHFWSLAVEEHFYLLWPLLIFFVSPRALPWFCAGVMVLALGTRVVLAAHGSDTFYLTPCRIDALAAGSLATVLARRADVGIGKLLRWARRGTPVCALLLLALYIFTSGARLPVMQAVKFSIIAVFFSAVLVLCVAADPSRLLGRTLTHSWLRGLGKYSYGVYVFHGLFLPFFDRAFGIRILSAYVPSLFVATLLKVILATSISLAAAWLSWHGFEKHFLRLKVFFDSRRPPQVSPGQDSVAVHPA